MSEVVSRGSFVCFMGNNSDKISDMQKALAFDTYDEFCKDKISEAILFSRYEKVDNKNTKVEYQAKNERYNADYFEKNNLIVAFFETDLNVNEFIVSNVELSGGVCNISVVGALRSEDKQGSKVPYACFIETTDVLPKNLTAKVEIEHTSLFSSLTSNFSDEQTASDIEKVGAHLFGSVDELTKYIAGNALISETSSLKTVLNMHYNEEFFQNSKLLLVETPGKFYGYYHMDGNSVFGIRLDSDHYDTRSFEDVVAPSTRKAVAVMLSVPKDFNAESLTFSFSSYAEWEQGVVADNTQSGQITLVRNDRNPNVCPTSRYVAGALRRRKA